MEAKELRIGNLIYINHKQAINQSSKKFTLTCMMDLVVNGTGSKFSYNPILLTEDWLIKFGFRKYNNKNHFKKHWVSGFININGIFCLLSYNQRHHNITYVHQLQNLYFALTNKELTIK